MWNIYLKNILYTFAFRFLTGMTSSTQHQEFDMMPGILWENERRSATAQLVLCLQNVFQCRVSGAILQKSKEKRTSKSCYTERCIYTVNKLFIFTALFLRWIWWLLLALTRFYRLYRTINTKHLRVIFYRLEHHYHAVSKMTIISRRHKAITL